MSLSVRLVLVFAGVSLAVFGVVGLRIVAATGETVERGVEDRIDATLGAVRRRPDFFLIEAAHRGAELRQVADIAGFEIVVPGRAAGEFAATTLEPGETRTFLLAPPAEDRFRTVLAGTAWRGARAEVGGRPIYLFAREAPIEQAKREAVRTVAWTSAAGLAALVVFAALLAGTVTRPLRRLAERTAAVREADPDPEMPAGGGREVEQLSAAFADLLRRIARYREELVSREKLATLGGFSAAVAHELRNPLSSMRMTLQMLAPRVPPAEREEVEHLLGEMTRLDHSVEELLFYSGEPRYAMAEADLAAVAKESAAAVGPLARHLDVALEVEAAAGPVAIRGDARKLRQATMNLLLNAVHASPPGGRVAVTAGADGPLAFVEVADEGPGVPEAIAEKLFTPFTSGREGGTGLGLSIARAIARAHGGDVSWRRAGGRTIFRLTAKRGD